MKQENILENKTATILLLLIIAYVFSVVIRMYWPIHFSDNMSMYYTGELMINTNDGYFFSSAARDIIEGITRLDAQRASAYGVSEGLVLLTVYVTKFTPFSIETVVLYLPAFISSLIVVPIILVGRMLGHTGLGFLAALLGSITWSYYNRTMVGYYDTDMFSVLLQFTIFYGFLSVIYKKNIASILFTSFFITIYPYFYSQGLSIVFVVFMFTVTYLTLEYKGFVKIVETNKFQKDAKMYFSSIILLSISLMISLPTDIRIALFVVVFVILSFSKIQSRYLLYFSLLAFFSFLVFGNIFENFYFRIMQYLDKGTEEVGLRFYQVVQTVREAGSIPMTTVAHRITGSDIGLLLSLIGYVLLVIRHKPFIIALPLIGVGLFSYVGGLRFTVYAVPIAALSAVYLFYKIAALFKDEKLKYGFIILATAAMIYPNIQHVMNYKVPTVLNVPEVDDLVKLNKIASNKDYTLTWWDYGYPIWYYSDTNTLIDGGKHTKDNFIISTIMQTSSPELAANLSRLAIETYVENNYTMVAKTLFEDKNDTNPETLLSELENDTYILPKKTRNIYLYFPFKMLHIFPTVITFGNLDLLTGKKKRNVVFYPTTASSNKNGVLGFQNGIIFDTKKGIAQLGKNKVNIKYFVVTQDQQSGETQVQSQIFHQDGKYVVVYMKSFGKFIVMDIETFHSMYVQMYILGKYDKTLFERVVSSPYSKIYKLKK